MVFKEVSVVPGTHYSPEVALAQKGPLVRIFRHAISLFTVISATSRYLALLEEIYRLCGSFRGPSAFLETRPGARSRCFAGSRRFLVIVSGFDDRKEEGIGKYYEKTASYYSSSFFSSVIGN